MISQHLPACVRIQIYLRFIKHKSSLIILKFQQADTRHEIIKNRGHFIAVQFTVSILCHWKELN